LSEALSVAEARFRSLSCDRTDLQLEPTEDDIAALHAEGYLGEVINELQSLQQSETAEAARDALAILAGLLKDKRTEEAQ
jgi:hypothetical protein